MRDQEGFSGFRPKLICIAVASCFVADAALANPTGPTVVHGTATFKEIGNVLRITNSPNAVINWNSFSINANELTRFIQQSSSSSVLNRVVGSGGAIDPSVILGAMKSNGRVYLLNPSGVLFGAGSVVDVAGLIVGTQNLSNADFLANRLRFTDGAGAGSVVNQGHINTRAGGEVYLVGAAVTNGGVITSPQGQVILAAGERVELVNPGTPNLRVEVSGKDNKAVNLGQIVADSGRVGIYAGLVDHSGTIRANGAAVAEGGRIVLRGTKSVTLDAGSVTTANGSTGGAVTIQSGGQTLVAGTVEAKGHSGEGGTVQVLGKLVGLIDHASVDASGDTGGGTVLVGGDFQGNNPNIRNAFRTYVGEDAVIKADAITEGDGGRIIVWSDDATRFYGNISARGGAQGGDGGFAEVSSKGWLDYRGMANLSAPNGQSGTLLLDPNNVNITDETMSGGFDDGDPNIFSSGGFGPSNVHWGTVQANLASSDVVITTSGPDSVPGAITVVTNSPTLNSGNTLRLLAHDNIDVNGSISNAGSGNIELFAGWDGESPLSPAVNGGVGNISIASSKTVTTGGAITLEAGNTLTLGATNSKVEAGGDVLLKTQNGMSFAGTGNSIKGENIQIVSSGGLLAIDTGGIGGVRLAPADLGVLRLNDPVNGFVHLEGSHIDLNSPMVFDPAKVANLSLSAFGGSSIIQQSGAPLTVKNLLLLTNGIVDMPASNHVETLAAAVNSSALFFNNAQSLTIGSVGGYNGILVDGNSAATLGINVTGGGLTIDQPVIATAGFGDGAIALAATGNVIVNSNISANSTSPFSAYGGGVLVASTNGALQIKSGGSILAQGSAYGGDAGVLLGAGNGVTINGSVLAQASENPDGPGGTSSIQIAANGGPVTINQLVRASSGPGSDGAHGVAGIAINSSANIVLNANVETLGNGSFGQITMFAPLGGGIINVLPGMTMQAGGAIVSGGGILDAARGQASGQFPRLDLHAAQGIGTVTNPILIKDGSEANSPDIKLVNGSQGDIAVQFNAGKVVIDDLLGTYNANPNGTYYIKAAAGDIELGAPFHPGLETTGPLLPGQSVALVASGNIHLSSSEVLPPAVLVPSGIVASGSGKVLIDAGGSILTDAGTSLGGSVIDLKAGSAINSGANITGGSVSLDAGSAISLSPDGSISGGPVSLIAGTTINSGANISGGPVSLTATSGAISLGGNISGGPVSLTAGTTINSGANISGGSVSLDAGTAISLGGNISGGPVSLTAGTTINSGANITGSSVSLDAGSAISSTGNITGPVSARAGGDIMLTQSQSITLGLLESTSSNGTITVITSGAILDGSDSGFNISARNAVLSTGQGVDGIETHVNNLSGHAANGPFNLVNSGDLNLLGLTVDSGNAEIQSTALMQVVGPVTVFSGNLALLANNGVMIGKPLQGAAIPAHKVTVSGDLEIHSGAGDMGISETSVSANNITLTGKNIFIGFAESTQPTSVIATNQLTVTTQGNLNVIGGANPEAHAVLQGLNVDLNIGATPGNPVQQGDYIVYPGINIIPGPGGASAQIRAGSPDTITITFPNLGVDGYAVNETQNAIYDASTNSGFFTNNQPAVLGEGLIVTYGQLPPPPPVVNDPGVDQVVDQVVANINNTTDLTDTGTGNEDKTLTTQADPKDPDGKGKKDGLPVCK